jgi:nitrite reductase/ring-hydroxylating ferredoxin subunit
MVWELAIGHELATLEGHTSGVTACWLTSTTFSGARDQFDLRTGRCRHDATLVLHRYPATVVDGDVWIELIG